MVKWEIRKEPREGNRIGIALLRDGSKVSDVEGFVREPAGGSPKYVEMRWIGAQEPALLKYQQEYMEAHEGLKMGEALGLELLKSLKKEGVSFIHLGAGFPRGARFVGKGISSGIVKRIPNGFLRINWDKFPATEKATKKMIAKIRAKETRAAKIKRALEWVGRTARKFRKPRPK